MIKTICFIAIIIVVIVYFYSQIEYFVGDKSFAKPKEEITSDSIYEETDSDLYGPN
jgi:hypothetical protein